MRALIPALLLAACPLAAEQTPSRSAGLAAWDRIYAVASHPRCTNCHVGNQEAPMWNGLGLGVNRKHGMNIRADDSRIGAESIPCRACHVTSARPNTIPHAAPHIDAPWQLAPTDFAWLGQSSRALCTQLRQFDEGDGPPGANLAAHIRSSPFVAWGFTPGAGRSAPHGSIQILASDIEIWGKDGYPCP